MWTAVLRSIAGVQRSTNQNNSGGGGGVGRTGRRARQGVPDHGANRIDTTEKEKWRSCSSRDGQDQRFRPERIAIKTARPSCWETNELARTTAHTDGLEKKKALGYFLLKNKKNSAYAHLTHTHTHCWTTLPWTWRRKRPSLEAETSDLDHLFTHFSVSSFFFISSFSFFYDSSSSPCVSVSPSLTSISQLPPSSSIFPNNNTPTSPVGHWQKKKSETTTQTRETKNRNSRRAPELTEKKSRTFWSSTRVSFKQHSVSAEEKKSNPPPSSCPFMTLDDDHVARGANRLNGGTGSWRKWVWPSWLLIRSLQSPCSAFLTNLLRTRMESSRWIPTGWREAVRLLVPLSPFLHLSTFFFWFLFSSSRQKEVGPSGEVVNPLA